MAELADLHAHIHRLSEENQQLREQLDYAHRAAHAAERFQALLIKQRNQAEDATLGLRYLLEVAQGSAKSYKAAADEMHHYLRRALLWIEVFIGVERADHPAHDTRPEERDAMARRFVEEANNI